MFKKFYISIIICLLSLSAFAQLGKVNNALRSLQAGDLVNAKAHIDEAIKDEKFNKSARTWYWRGYIYKDLFKENKDNENGTGYRLESISSLRKSLELDTAKEFDGESKKVINYLANTLYNESAAALNRALSTASGEGLEGNLKKYDLFKELMYIVNPGFDFRNQDIQFYLTIASTYSRLYEASDYSDSIYIDKTTKSYEMVLELDSNNLNANYNLGIFHYNQAVKIIEEMDYEMNLVRLYEIQEECISLFLKALPYMKKAYELNPKRKETLIGLSGIYFSLNDIEKSELFKGELEQVKKEEEGSDKQEDK